jgi:hypothetical protein
MSKRWYPNLDCPLGWLLSKIGESLRMNNIIGIVLDILIRRIIHKKSILSYSTKPSQVKRVSKQLGHMLSLWGFLGSVIFETVDQLQANLKQSLPNSRIWDRSVSTWQSRFLKFILHKSLEGNPLHIDTN